MTTLIVRVAIAVMALHVADDSFLQPARGTSMSDHLVSGFVPLAALAAAAWAFPHLRAGARSVLALVLGPLGIALGAEAIYFWGQTGLSGDDYTGLAAIAAGAALLAVGTATLWTSRRVDDTPFWRYPRRLLLAGAAFLGLAWVVSPLALSYGFTHIGRAGVPAAELGTAYENVTLKTADGLALQGWYIPSRNGAAVIVYPGRGTAQKHARYLSRHGYGVLLFDRRGEGASDGDPHSFGWTFDEDIKAAVAFLQHRPDVDPGRIGGIGLSVGGEMMLQTAADAKGLAAVVSDGAGARVASEELSDLGGFDKLLAAPLYLVKTAAVAVFSNHAPPSDLTTYIPRIAPRPIMLIHAAKDEVDNKTPEYLASARGPAEEWTVPKGGHTAGIRTMPEEYARRVLGFFDRSLVR
jgi:dienelactone hydrolase